MARQQRRQLFAELLESRRLLAGMVEANFDGSTLSIVGDEEANVFEIAADSEKTLVITPDRDTALNKLAPGEPLRIDAVGLKDVFIFPGEGDDVVRVQGLNLPGGLHIEDSGHGNPVDSKASRTAIEKIEIAVEKVERAMRLAGGNGGGSVDVFDSQMGSLKVESDPGVDFAITNSRVHGGGYIKIGDIKGELTADGERSTEQGLDKTTPLLMQRSSFGKGLVIESARSLDVTLDKVSAAAVDMYLKIGDIKGEASTGGGGRIAILASEIKGDLSVESNHAVDFAMANSRAGGGGYIKIGDIKGESTADGEGSTEQGLDKTTPLLMQRSSFGEGLVVESTRSLDVTLDKVSAAAVDMYLKIGDIKGEASTGGGGRIAILASKIEGDLSVESNRPVDFAVTNSRVGGGGFIKIGAIADESIADGEVAIMLRRTVFGGDLTILGRNGQDRVSVDRLLVHGTTKIDLGGGNDQLTVINSVLKGSTRLDGGSGDEDVLILKNVTFEAEAIMEDWERTTGDRSKDRVRR